MKNKMFAKLAEIAAVILSATILSACGGAGDNAYSAATSMPEMAVEEAYYDNYGVGGSTYYDKNSDMNYEGQTDASTEKLIERKLIKNVDLEVETKEFDALMESLERQIREIGGYIENLNSYNGSGYSSYRNSRYANATIRIPQDRLDEFLNNLSGMCNVVRRGDSVDDVTLTYVDLQSRKDAYVIEQNRLLELLEQAESLEDILTIEDRLTTVRYQLESMESQLRTMDNQVNYSTVYLNISEVMELTPIKEETVWERISGGFTESLRDVGDGIVDFIIWFLVNIPHLLVWAVIITVVVWILRYVRKKRTRRKEKIQNEKDRSVKDSTEQKNELK